MDRNEPMPAWAHTLLREIETLKTMVRESRRSQWDYYDFIHRFRKAMKPDPDRGHFPEVVVEGRRIGVTLDGLLYDKESGETIDRMDAFKIYTTLYRHYKNRRNEIR